MRETEKNQNELFSLLSSVRPLDQAAMEAAGQRWNSIAKPIGSLGVLEEDLIKIAGIRENPQGIRLKKKALAVMCADHGVTAEGVSQTGQEVTRIVAENFTTGKTSAAVMCGAAGIDLFPVDMGMLGERSKRKTPAPFCLLDRKIREGSGNIAREAAMSPEECAAALLAGIHLAGDLKAMGYEILAAGEMGIGNTTPSSALAAAFTGLSADEATGRGAGLSDEGLLRKKAAVKLALERFFCAHPDFPRNFSENGREFTKEEALLIFSELGGFDLAGMAGLFLGGAVYRLPVVIDGYISSVSALAAALICPAAAGFFLASHVSAEPAGRTVLERLGLFAPLDLKMHLGEGTGAAALLPLLSMGAAVYETMSTFEEIQVKQYEDYGGQGS